MVPSQFSSTNSFQPFLQKVRSLDLGALAYQLMQSCSGPRWSRAKTVQAIARYLAFLYLIDRYPNLELVPPQDIDQVWHQHILDTQKYAADCQHLFGQFIHHFPYLGTQGEADQQHWYRAYALTQVLFRKHFDIDLRDASPADCEPLRSSLTCGFTIAPQQRPSVSVAIEDVLRLFL